MRRRGRRAGAAVSAVLVGALLAVGCAASAPARKPQGPQARASQTARSVPVSPSSAGTGGTAAATAEATAAGGASPRPLRSFPAGFWTGTDSWPVPVRGSAPYRAPGTGGAYSAPAIWTQIFGTGPAASIPGTYEWAYEPETANLADAPRGWCLRSGGCAQFFGGVTSSSRYAVLWQWSSGGGVRNAIGDFDQIDGNRLG